MSGVRFPLISTVLCGLLAVLPAAAWGQARSRADDSWTPARKLADLQAEGIDESSGLAAGGAHNPGILWTHNDSGDGPRVYAIDRQGRARGTWTLKGAEALDWEDMSRYERRVGDEAESLLLLADVGDNARARPELTLYLAREPKVPAFVAGKAAGGELKVEKEIVFRYPDEAHDCEGIGVSGDVAILVTKDRGEGTLVYAVRLDAPAGQEQVATLLAALPIERLVGKQPNGYFAMITAFDIAPNNRRAVVLTYHAGALEWLRRPDEGWVAAFRRQPRRIQLPDLTQEEALCYGPRGETLYLTSEKLPTPLYVVSQRVRGPY